MKLCHVQRINILIVSTGYQILYWKSHQKPVWMDKPWGATNVVKMVIPCIRGFFFLNVNVVLHSDINPRMKHNIYSANSHYSQGHKFRNDLDIASRYYFTNTSTQRSGIVIRRSLINRLSLRSCRSLSNIHVC